MSANTSFKPKEPRRRKPIFCFLQAIKESHSYSYGEDFMEKEKQKRGKLHRLIGLKRGINPTALFKGVGPKRLFFSVSPSAFIGVVYFNRVLRCFPFQAYTQADQILVTQASQLVRFAPSFPPVFSLLKAACSHAFHSIGWCVSLMLLPAEHQFQYTVLPFPLLPTGAFRQTHQPQSFAQQPVVYPQ